MQLRAGRPDGPSELTQAHARMLALQGLVAELEPADLLLDGPRALFEELLRARCRVREAAMVALKARGAHRATGGQGRT